MTLYRRIVREGLQHAIVLEDDAILQESFSEFLAHRAYEDYDLIQLCYGVARVWRFGIFAKRYGRNVSLKRVLYNSGSTVAYSISNRAAQFIQSNALPISLPADWPCDLLPLRPRIAVPRIVTHPELETGPSLLRNERVQRKLEKSYAGAGTRLSCKRSDGRNPRPVWYRFIGRYVSKHVPGLPVSDTGDSERAPQTNFEDST
jgi:GR25 family glycosyltransferase involved in LPS biosynthesis